MTTILFTNCINNNTSILMRLHSIHSFIGALCRPTGLYIRETHCLHGQQLAGRLSNNPCGCNNQLLFQQACEWRCVCRRSYQQHQETREMTHTEFTYFLALFSYWPLRTLRQYVIGNESQQVPDGATIVLSAMSNLSAMATYLSRLPIVRKQVIAFVKNICLTHEIHDHAMGLPHVTTNREVLTRIQLNMHNISGHRVAKFEFLYPKLRMSLVRHVLKKDYPVLHANHALVD